MNDAELQARFVYALIVAGKNATFADTKTTQLLSLRYEDELPFEMLVRLVGAGTLGRMLRRVRTGNYTKLTNAFRWLAVHSGGLDLRTATPAELEVVPGVGPKTSRFFILWSRPDARYAALDVHILRWLKGLGYPATRNTPSNPKLYIELEQAFLKEADRRKLTPRELDALIWEKGARGIAHVG